MLVQIHTDNHIHPTDKLIQYTEAAVKGAIGHLAEHITRVEVHLSDENAKKGGENDKRCLIEAKLKGLPAVAVTGTASDLEVAIDAAATRIENTLTTSIEKREDKKYQKPDIHPITE